MGGRDPVGAVTATLRAASMKCSPLQNTVKRWKIMLFIVRFMGNMAYGFARPPCGTRTVERDGGVFRRFTYIGGEAEK